MDGERGSLLKISVISNFYVLSTQPPNLQGNHDSGGAAGLAVHRFPFTLYEQIIKFEDRMGKFWLHSPEAPRKLSRKFHISCS